MKIDPKNLGFWSMFKSRFRHVELVPRGHQTIPEEFKAYIFTLKIIFYEITIFTHFFLLVHVYHENALKIDPKFWSFFEKIC